MEWRRPGRTPLVVSRLGLGLAALGRGPSVEELRPGSYSGG
jgi:hypothetical protein